MIEVLSSSADIAVAVAAGPLLAAGAAKILARPTRAAWPVSTGPFRAPAGPRVVGAWEVLAAFIAAFGPGVPAAVSILAAYSVLLLVAWRYRGRPCGCFGTAKLAALGGGHIAANAAGAVVGLGTLLLLPDDRSAWPIRVALAAGATAVTVLLVVWRPRRRSAGKAAEESCPQAPYGLRIYHRSDCGPCRALYSVLEQLEPVRRAAVTMVEVDEDNPVPIDLGTTALPCAQRISRSGTPICNTVVGLGGIRRSLEQLVILPVNAEPLR